MASWRFLTGPCAPSSSGPDTELADAHGKTVTWRASPDERHEATFSINGELPQAAAWTELQSDLWAVRDNTPLFRGRLVPSSDQLDENGHQVQATAYDYREVLRRRRLFSSDTLSWTAVDQASIVWAMIAATQGRSGGNLGIVNGMALTGTLATVTYAAGDMIGQRIADLAGSDTGFEWQIEPSGFTGLEAVLYSPYQGTNRGVSLEHGSTLVASVSRSLDPSIFADALLVTGDSTVSLTPQEPEAADIATRPEGRWDQVIGTSILTASQLAARATWELANAEVVIPSYTFALKPGAWQGPTHIWIGDQVRVIVSSGRLAVNDVLRVMELEVAAGDDDQETVTVTLGRVPARPYRTIPSILRRLRYLETR